MVYCYGFSCRYYDSCVEDLPDIDTEHLLSLCFFELPHVVWNQPQHGYILVLALQVCSLACSGLTHRSQQQLIDSLPYQGSVCLIISAWSFVIVAFGSMSGSTARHNPVLTNTGFSLGLAALDCSVQLYTRIRLNLCFTALSWELHTSQCCNKPSSKALCQVKFIQLQRQIGCYLFCVLSMLHWLLLFGQNLFLCW